MKKNKRQLVALGMVFLPMMASAQYAWQEGVDAGKLDLGKELHYQVETQGSFAKGKTPLWLNANKYGLSSLEKNNGYLRGNVIRPLQADSARRWGIGYGVDVAVPVNYTSHVVVQQAFVEARWLHGVLSVGAKEYPMQLKNATLSTGSQTLGINARPVPQVRLALPEYWTIPILHNWLHIKGHIAYGKMTDDNWQHDFTHRQSKYADDVLYHSKAGYLKIGNEDTFCPLSLELGLEMAATFGGTPYYQQNGEMLARPTNKGLSAYWHAFIPGGADATDGVYENAEGDQVGSWVFRINYDAERWKLGIYGDHFFEDDSQLFLLDYDGYGEGDNWMKEEKHRYYRYKLKDMMLGAELNLKYGTWLRNVVFEYIYTKYQSGPYNHDHTVNISDHLSGTDDYYNHSTYPGWQHWGQVMGNPLYRSPIYNTDGVIHVNNNRFIAYHLGWDGMLAPRMEYRMLATYQKSWGTYAFPFCKMHHDVSFLIDVAYHFKHDWNVRGAYAMDFSSNQVYGHNAGFQLTVSKSGVFNLGKKRKDRK